MIVLCLPGLGVKDVTRARMPVLSALLSRSAVGLVNTVNRATFAPDRERWDDEASAYLTLGMGGRGRSGPMEAPPWLDLPQGTLAILKRENEGGSRRVEPGRLGSLVRHAGLRVAALGCGDDRTERHREVLLAAMDATGTIGRGDVSTDCLRPESSFPYGLASNRPYLLERLRRLLPDTALIFLDPGDLQRAERYAPLCLPGVAARHREVAVRSADQLLEGVLGVGRERNTVVVVLAPLGPLAGSGRRETLTPMVWHDPAASGGLVRSGSTRRRGLVALTDLAGALSRAVTGRSGLAPDLVTTVASRNAWDEARTLAGYVARTDHWRAPGVRGAQIALLLGALLQLLWLRFGRPRWHPLALAAWPLAVFVGIGLAVPGGPGRLSLGTAAFLAAAGLLVLRRRGIAAALGCLYGGLALAVVLQLAPGGRALTDSALGHSLSLGARYYGIGNEWMGVLLGGTLTALLTVREWFRSPRGWLALAAGVLLGLAVALGLPEAGADFGGALTAAAAAGGVLWVYSPLRRRGWLVAGAVLAVLALLAALVAWDLLRPIQSQTHLARLLGDLRGGLPDLGATLLARLQLNARVTLSLWGVMLAVEAAAAWLAVRVLGKSAPRQPEGLERLRGAARAFGFAGGSALLLNDSGVTSAALLMACLVPALLILHAAPAPATAPGRERPVCPSVEAP